MKKDVIYIDIEDDITGIIGKVKETSSKIVALVPPKRIGVLQSAVNLKLLQKSAHGAGKRIVLITNDHSLTALAAGLKMPVAKNLQSRPEIPQLDSPEVPEEEVINGEELPVGELAAVAGDEPPEAKPAVAGSSSAADDISSQVDLRTLNDAPSSSKPDQFAKTKGGKKKALKVPNFEGFRRNLFLIGAAVIVLIVFLVWAYKIAPQAVVTITAKTSAISVDQTLTLAPNLNQSQVSSLQFRATPQQIKKSVSTDFTATGSKDIGNKAGGTVTVTNAIDSNNNTVPAGTVFTGADGHKFVSTADIVIPGAKVSGGAVVPGTAQGQLQATDIGPDYNVAAQSYTITGYDSLQASGSAMAGGTKQTVTVVAQSDVDKAQSQLAQQDTNAIKSQLAQQFGSDQVVINESFSTDQGTPSVTPAVGDQAQQGKLTVETTYTLLGVARADVDNLLNSALTSAMSGKPNMSIFSNGDNTLQFSNFQKFSNGTYSARMTTTGYIGSKIDTTSLATQFEGKRSGEIQAIANQIPNVNSVDVKLSPFWVSNAPSDPKKIDIKFTISNGN